MWHTPRDHRGPVSLIDQHRIIFDSGIHGEPFMMNHQAFSRLRRRTPDFGRWVLPSIAFRTGFRPSADRTRPQRLFPRFSPVVPQRGRPVATPAAQSDPERLGTIPARPPQVTVLRAPFSMKQFAALLPLVGLFPMPLRIRTTPPPSGREIREPRRACDALARRNRGGVGQTRTRMRDCTTSRLVLPRPFLLEALAPSSL